jgi:NAD(P)-dependent dehydrogenase (short-subunit alcohol dehydrogenase family)
MPSAVLDGRSAIITGAGRGIGRAFAIAFAREGAKVCVASRTPATVDEVVHLIRDAGGEAIGVRCDVGSAQDIQEMVAETVKAFGTVDILVNNAQGFGAQQRPSGSALPTPFEDTSEDEWNYMFQTGVMACVRSMKAVFPLMKAQAYGRIINLASAAGQTRAEGYSAYGSVKDAIRCLSGVAAREWGRYGITVNSICPTVATDAVAGWIESCPDDAAAVAARIPVRRFGDPLTDCAPAAVFLASEAAGYVTGQNLNVEGGLTIHA